MHNINTTVYLNDGADHFLGFAAARAKLREAARFTLELAADVPAQHLTNPALEIVFEQLNIDAPTTAWALRYRLARNRNLSVGDVVVIAETAWACASAGWTRVTTDELHAALVAR